MKKLLMAFMFVASFTACKKDNKSTDADTATTTNTDTVATATSSDKQMYSCSMHPEVTGMQGEKCSKCGMDLTEPVEM